MLHKDPSAWAADLREQLGELIANLRTEEQPTDHADTLLAIDRLVGEAPVHIEALRREHRASQTQGTLFR